MAMWNSRTNLWGKKTRLTEPVKANGKATKEVEHDEEYLEIEDKIKAMETEIKSLKERLNEKCCEIVSLQRQLSSNSEFMQNVVMELIRTKTAAPAVAPRNALEAYKAKKESEMSVKDINKATTEGKLP